MTLKPGDVVYDGVPTAGDVESGVVPPGTNISTTTVGTIGQYTRLRVTDVDMSQTPTGSLLLNPFDANSMGVSLGGIPVYPKHTDLVAPTAVIFHRRRDVSPTAVTPSSPKKTTRKT
ncbi:hypothetical protein HY214_03050 [Candidatus Roizmanbacteria bacterium]|nr:hypothetical protein [Candidatus Roizmanbacteria bacterium]